MEMISVAISGCLANQAGKTGEQDRQRDRHLETRQRRSDAEVDARAEGEMGIGIPPGVELGVGAWRAIGIAVGAEAGAQSSRLS